MNINKIYDQMNTFLTDGGESFKVHISGSGRSIVMLHGSTAMGYSRLL